jgi:hypothetical protein
MTTDRKAKQKQNKKMKKLYLAKIRERYPSAYRYKEHEDGTFTVFCREVETHHKLKSIRCRIKLEPKIDTK